MKVFIDSVLDEKGEVKGKLYVESDERQFVIKEYTGKVSKDKKTGKETEVYNNHGNYPNVEHCLNHIVKMKIMQSTATTLQELVEDIKGIKAFVASKFA